MLNFIMYFVDNVDVRAIMKNSKILHLVLLLLGNFFIFTTSDSAHKSGHDAIVFPPEGYDATESGKHGIPQDIMVSLFIESIIRINPSEMEFIVYTYVNQEWTDERLKRTNHHTVVLQQASNIWVPDIYCLNCRKSTLNQEHSKIMLRISENGDVYYSQPGLFYAACKFQYKNFPFDIQTCAIQFSSYSYNNSFVKYQWKSGVVLQKTSLEQFTVEKDVTMSTEVREYNSGNFTVLSTELQFTRQTGFYVIRLFVPSAMLVCLSWIAFYISPTEVGDRLAIGITLLLSMVFLLGYVDSSLPKVSYVKAIDWYLIMALIMIVASILESMIAYAYLRHKLKKDLDKNKKNKASQNGDGKISGIKKELGTLLLPKEQLHNHLKAEVIDELENGLFQTKKSNRFVLKRRNTSLIKQPQNAQEELRSKIFGESYVKSGFVARMEFISQILFPLVYIIYNALYLYHYLYKK